MIAVFAVIMPVVMFVIVPFMRMIVALVGMSVIISFFVFVVLTMLSLSIVVTF